jgi:uncharacterized protein YqhQ
MEKEELKNIIKETMEEDRTINRRKSKKAFCIFTGNAIGILMLFIGLVVFVSITTIAEYMPPLYRLLGVSVGGLFALITLVMYIGEVNHAQTHYKLKAIAEKLGITDDTV